MCNIVQWIWVEFEQLPEKNPTLLSPFGNCLFTIHVIILLQVLENNVHIFFLVLIGLLYPCLDRHLSISNPDSHKGEWSKVMRCIAVFVGINHASAVSFFHSWCQSYVKNHKWSFRLWISTIFFIFVEPESDVLITCKIRLFFISPSVLLHFLLKWLYVYGKTGLFARLIIFCKIFHFHFISFNSAWN